MVTLKLSLLLVLAAAATSLPQHSPAPTALPATRSHPARGLPRAANPALQSSEEFGHSYSYEDDAKYDFSWGVSDEDTDIGFHEERDGDNTQGSYSVLLPDGRRQTVTYYVDGDSGYVAKVTYEGDARYSDESDEFVRRG